MPSIGDVAVTLRAVLERVREAQASVESAKVLVANASANARAATVGSDSPLVREGIGQWQQADEAAEDAAAFLDGGRKSLEQYIAGIAGGGETGANGGAGGRPPAPPPPEPRSGWDSAPDLAAARDGMNRLGEVSGGRRAHILDGDGDGESGGHRWDSEIPDKTKFPYEWDDDKIIRAIGDVAQRPDAAPEARRRGGWICTGTREGIEIRVVINRDGQVWTGYPLRGPGVERNPGEW